MEWGERQPEPGGVPFNKRTRVRGPSGKGRWVVAHAHVCVCARVCVYARVRVRSHKGFPGGKGLGSTQKSTKCHH